LGPTPFKNSIGVSKRLFDIETLLNESILVDNYTKCKKKFCFDNL
jgi:hypothetical protein